MPTTATRERTHNVPTCKPANASVCCIIPRRGRPRIGNSRKGRRQFAIRVMRGIMKRTFFVFVLATLSMAILPWAFLAPTTPAQTPPPPLVSPDLHADRTVTFRFRAPNDKEVAVSIEGNPKPLPMQKDNQGVWSVTTESLAPDYYGYSFIADGVGMFDPSNYAIKPNFLG